MSPTSKLLKIEVKVTDELGNTHYDRIGTLAVPDDLVEEVLFDLDDHISLIYRIDLDDYRK